MSDFPSPWNYWEMLILDENGNYVEDTSDEALNDVEQFHSPDFRADFEKWGGQNFWNCDEAAALTFGKDPDVITREHVEEDTVGPSYFIPYYAAVRERILARQASGELPELMRPALYVEWARRQGIDFPDDLKEVVQQLERDRETERLDIRTLRQEKAELEKEVERLRRETSPDEDRLHPKERQSLLKLVLGLAMGTYSYDPRRARSGVPKELVSDLQTLGISLDEDTIRKWLRAAAEQVDLPPSE
jgi:hypothetical protein